MTSRCVVCALTGPRHGGLCCRHRYEEQPPCEKCHDHDPRRQKPDAEIETEPVVSEESK